jgi:ankyrin repeat protein
LNDTALHIAAWGCHHETVALLIERGAPVDVPDANGQTPLALAVRGCVESYWTERRALDSVRALLEAGANVNGVDRFPSGYEAVDELLRAYGAGAIQRARAPCGAGRPSGLSQNVRRAPRIGCEWIELRLA